MASFQESQVSPAQLAQLAALADGTPDPAHRPEVEALLASSPQLCALHERERRVVRLLHDAPATGRAPARLRARLDAQRPSARALARRRARYAGGLCGRPCDGRGRARAGVGLTHAWLALRLAGRRVGVRGPSQRAPGLDSRDPQSRLARTIDDVYFPNWFASLGWRAIGQRSDCLADRRAITVYYEWRGTRRAYTILGALALAQPSARITDLNGIELRTLTLGARQVLTWRRAVHACVLSAAGVTTDELEQLATWTGS
jgi:hypothetical protein